MRTTRTLALTVSALALAASALTVPSMATAGALDVAGTATPSSVAFADTKVGQTSATQTVTLTSTGSDPLLVTSPTALIGTDSDSFVVTDDTCNGASLSTGQSCTTTVAAKPQVPGDLAATLEFVDTGGKHDVPLTVHAVDVTHGLYYKVASARILDTRSGLGASKHPVKGGSIVHLQVLGKGHVPTGGASAVVLNLTVTHTTTGGHVTAFPGGSKQPNVSSINYAKGWTGANLVTVPIGANGKVDLYNSTGSVDLIADVQGWYASSDTVSASHGVGGAYISQTPTRIVDTRTDAGHHDPLPAGYTTEVAISYNPAIATPSQVHAVAITLTATGVKDTGYLTATAADQDPARTSTLNLRPGVTTPNMAIVSTEPCSESWCSGTGYSVVVFQVYNGSHHAVDVLVDLQGTYFDDTISLLRFHSLTPTRIVDTRIGRGTTPLGAKAIHSVVAPPSVNGPDTYVMVGNVTAVAPTKQTYLSVYKHRSGLGRPNVSNLNPRPGVIVATGAHIGVGDAQLFDIYNNAGRTDVLVDISGAFDRFPAEFGPARAGLTARGGTAGSAAATHRGANLDGAAVAASSRPVVSAH